MKIKRKLALLVGSVCLAACTQVPTAGTAAANGPAADDMAQPRLTVIPLTVVHGGQAHSFQVEVARTSEEQAKGLMFRTAMAPDQGMLFPMNPPRFASFWMHNTVLPLDIIYIDANHRIESIAANTTPYSDTPIPSLGMVSAVLELSAGRAAELGIAKGDEVRW